MLALGGLADTIGIPRAMEIVGLGAVGLALVSVVIARLPATAVTVTAPLSQSQEPQGEEA
jgi:hypothetical protein